MLKNNFLSLGKGEIIEKWDQIVVQNLNIFGAAYMAPDKAKWPGSVPGDAPPTHDIWRLCTGLFRMQHGASFSVSVLCTKELSRQLQLESSNDDSSEKIQCRKGCPPLRIHHWYRALIWDGGRGLRIASLLLSPTSAVLCLTNSLDTRMEQQGPQRQSIGGLCN